MSTHLLRRTAPAVAVLAAAALATACSGAAASSGSGHKTINLVAYSTPQQVYGALVPEFTKTASGRGASFRQSYGASGAQSRAVLAGQPADVVEFSLAPDMTKLVSAGIVAQNWASNPYHGMVTDSVVVLVVRKGNPKNIHGWSDLVRPGIKVVTPNVFSSGSARWNLMAAYGAQVKQGKSPAQALAFVQALLRNTVSQPESGSKATEAFVSGVGDVLISYENEAIKAQQAGKPVDYVIPDQTILIENPIAVTTKAQNPSLARAFVSFLYTDQAQKTFAQYGYRPVVKADLDTTRFPTPAQLFTIDDLGGWSTVTKQFFDPATGSITKIENALGVSGG
jgi:sulfate transport system substrate-binding protein